MTSRISIQDAILRAHKDLKGVSERPGSDAQLILADILNRNRAWIMAHPEFELRSEEWERYLRSLGRYVSGDPLPYVLGWWEFYGRRFKVDESVLIPRPETETLVELALRYLHSHPQQRSAFDVGTGSGCIAISLLAEVEDLQMTATDISYEALKVARDNAIVHDVVSRGNFIQMDLMTSLRCAFDVICANLPYIATGAMEDLEVAKKEPWHALDGGEDGLLYIRQLLRDIPQYLRCGGLALLELEAGTSRKVLEMVQTHHANADIEVHPDLSGQDRVLAIKY